MREDNQPISEERSALESIYERNDLPDNLHTTLGRLALRRLTPVLVHTMEEFTELRRPPKLYQEYVKRYEFFGPSALSQRDIIAFTSLCYDSMPNTFVDVNTSPIAPIGTNSVLTEVSQNNTLSTIRGSEVVSDVTTQLALECAYRSENEDYVKLCSMGRVLRLQPFDKSKGYMQHFNLFALCSGGKAKIKSSEAITDHIDALLHVISGLISNGYDISNTTVKLTDIRFINELIEARGLPDETIKRNSLNDSYDLLDTFGINFPKEINKGAQLNEADFKGVGLKDYSRYYNALNNNVLGPLRDKFPDVEFTIDFNRKAGMGYYNGLCFHIFGDTAEGTTVQLADGGAVDWLAKLKSDNKYSMTTSGIGAELIQKLFKPPQ